MDFILYCLGIILFVILLLLLNFALPNFKQYKVYAQRAQKLASSEIERRKRKRGKMVSFLSERLLPKLNKNPYIKLEVLLGRNIHEIIAVMGRYESLYEMVAIKTVRSLTFTAPIALFCFMLNGLYFIIPIVFIVILIKETNDVKRSFAQMQREITKDLPTFIEHMKMALETGKSFIHVFREMEGNCGPKMQALLKRLNTNLQDMEPSKAIEIFARETTLPVMLQFATAVKIGIESGYEEAKEYFDDIKFELVQLRTTSIIEITKSRPQRVRLLSMSLILYAIISVPICLFPAFSTLISDL
ncbi:hypothetical protein ACE41H_15380 [Paenibacillus enshidis]|uniref:Type II secretion system protein GspF domain-containing protein n=1 Tax=Paenibacillus enshidis TaxID=1458439 RepID=A0ABV5AXM6_9BACL